MTKTPPDLPSYTKKDFMSDQVIRWCPGCGDYSILSQVQTTFSKLGIPKEKFAVISGIGCSSRFPYYMNTYGFHTIHGRAPAFATGLKLTNPELSVWVITGDGDSLSIGGNHLIHVLRRNVDLNILLFNNRIYGLTKGQYSPTSEVGKRTKSSPMGSVDEPFNPLTLALGAQASFVARSVDVFPKHLRQTLMTANDHKGTSFVEIYQNCVIFNDGAFDEVADKKVRDDRTVDLVAGQPMVFGKEGDKGLRWESGTIVRCAAAEADVWDPTLPSAARAYAMSTLDEDPDLPNPIGVFRAVEDSIFEDEVNSQIRAARENKGEGTLEELIYSGETWEVS